MPPDTGPGSPATLSPDEAFAVLGDDTRLEILRALAAADGPLAYSKLFDRVEYDDATNFSYHLGKLTGHFVRKTDEGYDLWEAGRRVVEAVLSGAVTETPVIEPTETDEPCPYCGAPVEVGFQHARMELRCTECPGFLRHADSGGRRFSEHGSLGYFLFPPAGVRGRTASEALDAAWTWMHADVLVRSAGVCSRCSAPLDHSATACEAHDAEGGFCDRCGRRHAVRFESRCSNCGRAMNAIAPGCLLANTELLAFLTEHGVNPLAPESTDRALRALGDYDEEVVSADPFEARFTFHAGDETLTLTLDDDLCVTAVTRNAASDSRSRRAGERTFFDPGNAVQSMTPDIPTPGLGTYENTDPETCAESVRTALEMGYRHVDTAQMYGNESAVGDGIAAADVPREEVFVATKLDTGNLAYDDAVTTARESAERLGVEVIDLLYVHWPVDSYDPEGTLAALDDLRDDGLIRHVGLSNFTPDLIADARERLDSPVAAHQVETHPLLPQTELLAEAKAHDTALVAYSPVMKGRVGEYEPIRAVADAHDATPVQVSLAWLDAKGATPIPKSASEAHIRENLAAFDLELTDDEVARIDAIEETERIVDPDDAPWHA